MTIDRFEGEYEFLSNFATCSIYWGDHYVATVEHAYQAAKATAEGDCLKIIRCKTPGEAKRMGRTIACRPDWDTIKLEVMEILLRRKFTKPIFRDKLLATGTEELVEGNTWGDTFWGVCRGQGENHLGKLLMKIRSELRNE